MSKLLSRSSTTPPPTFASRVRNAFVRGIFLIAAVLLFAADAAVAQTAQHRTFFNDRIAVQTTQFPENAGTPATSYPAFGHFYIWARGQGLSGSTSWTISLHSGTGANAAVKGEDFNELLCAGSGATTCSASSTGTLPIAGSQNVTFPIIDDQLYEGGPTGTPETFILRLSGSNNLGSFTYDVTMRIVDNDAPPPTTTIGGGMHAVARAEALVDNQPRLVPMLRNPGAQATEFLLRASDGGVDAASGGFQGEAVWGATSLSRTSDGFGEHEHLQATLGAHFRMSERLHLGGMLQFDRSGTKPGGEGASGEIAGNGWMVGPYFAARDASSPLYFEGRLLYGRSSNDVEDYVPGTQDNNEARSASFVSERWLIQGRVEGTHDLGNGTTLIPLADFSHARDEMEAFQARHDGIAQSIAGGSRTVAVTKLQLGAEFEIPVDTARGDLKLRPGLRLVVSDVSNAGVAGNATVGSGEAAEYRGRIDFGVDYRLEDNLVLGFESFYSGNGREKTDEFESYGAGLNLQFEF